MKPRERRLCRLCLRAISNEKFEAIGEIILKILEVLQLNLNSHVGEEHIVCNSCMGSIQECLDFKSTYLNTEDYIVPLYNFETESKLDLREVYLHKNKGMETAEISRNQEICRLCMKLNKRFSCKPLIEIEEDVLQKCIPELNFNLTTEPVICNSCLNSLKLNFRFLQTCMDTEEKIVKYCTFEATSTRSEINLHKVVKFIKNNNNNTLEHERSMAKVNVDLDYEGKKNDIIQFEIELENENAEFDRENVENDIKTDIEENVKMEVNEDSLELQNQELGKCGQNINLNVSYESKENTVIKTEIKIENENVEFGRENAENEIKTDVEGREDSSELHKGELGIIYEDLDEDNGLQTKQSNFESFQDASTSSHLIMKNTNLFNPNDHIVTHQALSEEMPQNLEKADEIEFTFNYRNPSKVSKYKCQSCSFTTKHEACLKRHMLTSTHRGLPKVKLYTCKTCPFITKCKSIFNDHMLVHASILYRCYQCSLETKNKHYLKLHMLTHQDPSEATALKCKDCTYVAKHNKDLNVHTRTHRELSKVTVYNCGRCLFQTKYRTSMKYHRLTHQELSEVEVYTCKTCAFTTIYKGNLKSHMTVHQSSEIVVYKCDRCSFKSKYKGSLKNHLLTCVFRRYFGCMRRKYAASVGSQGPSVL